MCVHCTYCPLLFGIARLDKQNWFFTCHCCWAFYAGVVHWLLDAIDKKWTPVWILCGGKFHCLLMLLLLGWWFGLCCAVRCLAILSRYDLAQYSFGLPQLRVNSASIATQYIKFNHIQTSGECWSRYLSWRYDDVSCFCGIKKSIKNLMLSAHLLWWWVYSVLSVCVFTNLHKQILAWF